MIFIIISRNSTHIKIDRNDDTKIIIVRKRGKTRKEVEFNQEEANFSEEFRVRERKISRNLHKMKLEFKAVDFLCKRIEKEKKKKLTINST